MSITLDGSNATTGGLINVGTAQNSTSGTSVLFTGIPATAKRITVMFNGVKTSGTSTKQLQIGSGSLVTTGYTTSYTQVGSAGTSAGNLSTGFPIDLADTTMTNYGSLVLNSFGNNIWMYTSIIGRANEAYTTYAAGAVSLSGALDRVNITTVNGTDTFTAGSINILWE
jgi:hypothetical protein